MATVSISIPTDHMHEFRQMWKALRLAEALDPQNDLEDPIEIGNFDGATLVKWVVELQPVIVPIVTASLTYLITSRGEIEYQKGKEKLRFKNIKPSQVKEIISLIDDRKKG